MSEAPRRTASVRIPLISLTTGASSIAAVAAAASLGGEQGVLPRQLGRDELGDPHVDLELREVHRRHAELARQHPGEIELLQEAHLHQVVPEAAAVLLLLDERLLELLDGDEPLLEEELSQALSCGDR